MGGGSYALPLLPGFSIGCTVAFWFVCRRLAKGLGKSLIFTNAVGALLWRLGFEFEANRYFDARF